MLDVPSLSSLDTSTRSMVDACRRPVRRGCTHSHLPTRVRRSGCRAAWSRRSAGDMKFSRTKVLPNPRPAGPSCGMIAGAGWGCPSGCLNRRSPRTSRPARRPCRPRRRRGRSRPRRGRRGDLRQVQARKITVAPIRKPSAGDELHPAQSATTFLVGHRVGVGRFRQRTQGPGYPADRPAQNGVSADGVVGGRSWFSMCATPPSSATAARAGTAIQLL